MPAEEFTPYWIAKKETVVGADNTAGVSYRTLVGFANRESALNELDRMHESQDGDELIIVNSPGRRAIKVVRGHPVSTKLIGSDGLGQMLHDGSDSFTCVSVNPAGCAELRWDTGAIGHAAFRPVTGGTYDPPLIGIFPFPSCKLFGKATGSPDVQIDLYFDD